MDYISIDHEVFEPMRSDFNAALYKLFSIMAETNRNAGKISCNINVELSKQTYTDPNTGEFRIVNVPLFEHKIKVSVKNEGSVQGISVGEYEMTITPEGAKIGLMDDGQENLFEKEGN